MMPKKMGRPKVEIDKRRFEVLCGMQATEEEICAVLGGDSGPISPHTLNRWCKETYGEGQTFCKVYKQKRQVGKVSLRRAQWALAPKSVPMAIFLGKNYLGQSDQNTTRVGGIPGEPVQTENVVKVYLPDNKRND